MLLFCSTNKYSRASHIQTVKIPYSFLPFFSSRPKILHRVEINFAFIVSDGRPWDLQVRVGPLTYG